MKSVKFEQAQGSDAYFSIVNPSFIKCRSIIGFTISLVFLPT